MTNLKVHIGQRIRDARELAGWTQQTELARRLGVPRQTLNDWETGQSGVSWENLQRIAELTGRKLSFFLPDSEKADLAATLLALYPKMDAGTVRSIMRIAQTLYEDDLKYLAR